MNVDVRSAGRHLTSLTWATLRSFVGTVLVLTLAGGVLAGLSCYFLREYHWSYGAIAVLAALIESVATGFFLGVKRAVVAAVVHELHALRPGRTLVQLIFERMLGVGSGAATGEPGGWVSRGLERLPLARAEGLLRGAVLGVTGDTEQGGWLRRKIRARMLGAIRKYTLARFREEATEHGGIDLLKVKDELERTIDDAMVQKLRSGLRLWTALVMIGLPLVVAAQTWVAVLLLSAK